MEQVLILNHPKFCVGRFTPLPPGSTDPVNYLYKCHKLGHPVLIIKEKLLSIYLFGEYSTV